jgi:photosystem II stability/assembly factor-like uncharacterized protein
MAGIIAMADLSAQDPGMDVFKNLKPRNIGPGGMSGRVTAIDVQLSDPSVIWVGTASGGLWRSKGGGTVWEPVFDNEKVAGIGALAIDQKKPDVVWVGTGEGNPRNSLTGGYGIYRTPDGGKSWKLMGLENTRYIHRIIIHPHNSDIIYAGAIGTPWGASKDRGVYKTTDGGKSWKQILYVNEFTGVADMIIDPFNPDKLYVAMWDHLRQPWFFRSGGPGSGLYLTVDAGENWKNISVKDGLPSGELGRIGLAAAKNKAGCVYAIVESKNNFGLYRSDDGGYSWKLRGDKEIGNRPFYYAEIYVDPANENRLYSLFSNVNLSEDGGRSFSTLINRQIHSDHHAWYIHPENPSFMIDGNDGGLAITYDMGKTWRHIANLPVSQFYHIDVDMEQPYNVLGGMQDNGSWRGPGYFWGYGGIINTYWDFLNGGDGFDVAAVPGEPDLVYAMSQEGYLRRINLKTGEAASIKPVHPEGLKLRFHWNSALATDPFDNNTLYYGSQFVHRSKDRGNSWEIISPDLTTNNPERQNFGESGGLTYDVTGAENYTTILAIAPSPVKQDVIWVGTDDGNIQLTTNGGITWTNTALKIKDYPNTPWVPQIVPSAKNEGEAFVVVNNYRQNDVKPYLFHTTNYGKTWENLVSPEKVWGWTLAFAQDPVEPKLMFLGTEFGLYVSFDGGSEWKKWTHGYPTVATIDLKIHPREYDLVIGTFGRSAWILDDIRPLREIARQGKALFDKTIVAFEPPVGVMAVAKNNPGYYFTGDAYYEGENREIGAMISYFVKDGTDPNELTTPSAGSKPSGDEKQAKKDSVKIKVYDNNGNLVRTINQLPVKGVNRFTWGFDRNGIKFPSAGASRRRNSDGGGPPVLPGTYTLAFHYKSDSAATRLTVVPDPRISYDFGGMKRKEEQLAPLLKKLENMTTAMEQVKECSESMQTIERLATPAQKEQLKEITAATKKALDPVYEAFYGKEEILGIYENPKQLTNKLSDLYGVIWSTSPLTPNQLLIVDQSIRVCDEGIAMVKTFLEKEWAGYRTKVDETDVSVFKELKKID